MSRAKNPNAPENWLAWLRGCQQDPHCPIEARAPLAMLTGTDIDVMGAIAACLNCYGRDPQAALLAVRALLPVMQEKCWPFARELIAQQLDWPERDKLWPLVVPTNEDNLITVTLAEQTPMAMIRALKRLAFEFELQAKGEAALEERRAARGTALEDVAPGELLEVSFPGGPWPLATVSPRDLEQMNRARTSVGMPELIARPVAPASAVLDAMRAGLSPHDFERLECEDADDPTLCGLRPSHGESTGCRLAAGHSGPCDFELDGGPS